MSGAGASSDLRAASTSGGAALRGQSSTRLLQIGVIQAVDIPAGLSVVRFSYDPDGYSKGLAIAAGTLAVTLAGCVAGLAEGRRRRRRRAPEGFGEA